MRGGECWSVGGEEYYVGLSCDVAQELKYEEIGELVCCVEDGEYQAEEWHSYEYGFGE